ncbi:hypothetical protein PG993_009504 [Apiospora rasikravindrae]|uniref:F-box domain-containing protein n=1 Tax=Apiospora rasikravindrae TaxID=990691 RepID=A0ABR1SJS1_9PEZI
MDSLHICDGTQHDGPPTERNQRPEKGLLSLPAELLSHIYEHFRAGHRYKKTILETSKALRLTCRRLSAAATPMLLSTLTIRLDTESVCRAEEKLSRNPAVAASVRTVAISLACRDPNLVDDIDQFVEVRLGEIDAMCEFYDIDWRESRDERDRTDWESSFERKSPVLTCNGNSGKLALQEIECLRNAHRISDAWDGGRYMDEDGNPEDASYDWERDPVLRDYKKTGRQEDIRAYRDLIYDAHEIYSRKHQQQLELIESGSFVQAITRCLDQINHKNLQVIITDNPLLGLDNAPLFSNSAPVINDKERLFSAMIATHRWLTITEDQLGLVLLPAVRLLLEIPVACYRAGKQIIDLEIDCFPTFRIVGGFSVLFPMSSSLSSASEWTTELETACQQLKSIEFCCHYPGPGWHLLSEDDQVHLSSFLTAMLSGDKLESIYVDTYPFGGTDSHGEHLFYSLGPALGAVDWTKVHTLHLRGFSVSYQVIKTICRQLNGAALQVLRLSDAWLFGDGGGSWADVLDILRHNLRCRWGDNVFGLDLQISALGNEPNVWEQRDHLPQKPMVTPTAIISFLLGEMAENPLRREETA